MAEENTKSIPELSIDEEAQMRLLVEANAIQRGKLNEYLEIGGKVWRLRPMAEKQLEKIENIGYDVMAWQNAQKEAKSAREIKRLNKKIHKAFAKKAAHKILGRRLWLVPFLFPYMWRRLYHCSAKVIATINATEIASEDKVFSLANWGSLKQVFVRSMALVGESVKQRTQRMESAESMVVQDGLPKKEGSK